MAIADLHLHSRYSRACSKNADLEGYWQWGRIKGIDILGTSDFTQPRWVGKIAGTENINAFDTAPLPVPFEVSILAACPTVTGVKMEICDSHNPSLYLKLCKL